MEKQEHELETREEKKKTLIRGLLCSLVSFVFATDEAKSGKHSPNYEEFRDIIPFISI